MAIIQECHAETSTAPGAALRWFRPFVSLTLAIALLGTAVTTGAQQIQHQSGSTVELPPTIGSQSGNLSTIPRKPGQNVLVIPRASHDFVGEWGGHVRLTRVVGMEAPPSGDSIVSLAFGESGGTVFMQTTAFAGHSSHIVDTSADVINPKTIRVTLRGLEMAFDPPIIHKEELHLALTGRNTLNCLKYVDFFQPGRDVPVASMAFEGDLHPLSPEERQALTEQVLKKGQIPQKQIEGSRRFGP